MNPRSLIQKLTQKKVQDYTFTILFFFIFSFFVIGAIRPNLLTVFRLQRELEELRVMDTTYEDVIINIVDNQAILEANRDNFYLLDEAVPETLQLYKLIDDIQANASESGIVFNSIQVAEIPLRDKEQKAGTMKNFVINLETSGTLAQAQQFISTLLTQRRLKVINKVSLSDSNDFESTASANINIVLEMESYYSL